MYIRARYFVSNQMVLLAILICNTVVYPAVASNASFILSTDGTSKLNLIVKMLAKHIQLSCFFSCLCSLTNVWSCKNILNDSSLQEFFMSLGSLFYECERLYRNFEGDQII